VGLVDDILYLRRKALWLWFDRVLYSIDQCFVCECVLLHYISARSCLACWLCVEILNVVASTNGAGMGAAVYDCYHNTCERGIARAQSHRILSVFLLRVEFVIIVILDEHNSSAFCTKAQLEGPFQSKL
jgi:hypothetical protein